MTMPDQGKPTRRSVLKGIPAALAASVAPAAVLAADDLPANGETLPDWWEKLTGASAETDPEVFAPWPVDHTNRKLAVKLQELHDLILESAPEGVRTIQRIEVQFSTGACPQNVICTGRAGISGESIRQFRPEFGWADITPGGTGVSA